MWILIVLFITNAGTAVITVPGYQTQQQCEAASKPMPKPLTWGGVVQTYCIPGP